MRTANVCAHTLAAFVTAVGLGLAAMPTASADDTAVDGQSPAVQVNAVPTSDAATTPAVTACATFAQVLDGTSTYYGEFADSLEGTDYSDPGVQSTNQTGRTALREGASTAMQAANLPGVDPAIAEPMRSWSYDAVLLLAKMGLRIPGTSLDTTATKMNDDATQVQLACAAAGTHA